MEIAVGQMQANAQRATALLKSMANETRLLILCQLSQGEMSVGELAKELPLSQSALSQHLALLRREKLVRTRRESQFVWYSIDREAAQAVIATINSQFCEPKPGEG
jgi:DNA-binding transcriptional ArsR family regulator